MTSVRTLVTAAPSSVRRNNFDAFRLLGAFFVIVGHGYVLTGRGSDVPVIFGEGIHSLGVVIFFSLSGYLITGSWLRFRSPRPYLAARLLRIIPALAVVVLVAAFLLGPSLTTLPLSDYFTSPLTASYLANAVLFARYELPGVFQNLPHGAGVNGSLWTLAPEFLCYLLVPLLVWRYRARLGIALMLLAAACCVVVPRTALAAHSFWGANLGDSASVARYFFVGGALAVLSTVVPTTRFLSVRYALVALLTITVVERFVPAVHGALNLALLPYAIVSLGIAASPVLASAARWGDLSYGMYLWAFPVQQTLVLKFGVLPVWSNIALVTLVSGGLAWLSWHLVEAPALRLKRRLRP